MKFILLPLAIYLFILVCWVFYLAVMHLSQNQDRASLPPSVKIHAYAALAVGYTLDLVLAWIIAPVLFLSIPKELTFTAALKRHKTAPNWRSGVATWICDRLLNPFDPLGRHC